MTIPIEFVVAGRPSSVNGTSDKKRIWKTKVSSEGNAKLAATFQILPAPYIDNVALKIFFFPNNLQYTDIDNGVKHTLDALSVPNLLVLPIPPFAPILQNDKTVLHLTVERFAPHPGASLPVSIQAAPTLLEALSIASGQAIGQAGARAKPEYATAIKFEPYSGTIGGAW
jgi:hypothetical protein